MTSETQHLETTLKKRLHCGICLDVYQDARMLDCQHSFCLGCVSGLTSRATTSIACPICRRSTSLITVEQLPRNLMLNELVELLHMPTSRKSVHEHTNLICDDCGDDEVDVNCKCIDCGLTLCTLCTNSHGRRISTRMHTLRKVSNLTVDELKLKPTVRYCEEHPEESLKLWCDVCELLICRDCSATKHVLHSAVPVRDIAEKYRDSITKKLHKLQPGLDQLTDQASVINSRIDEVHRDTKRAKEKLNYNIEGLISKLILVRDEALSAIQCSGDAQADAARVFLTEISACRETTTAYLQEIDSRIRSNCDVDILLQAKGLEDRISALAVLTDTFVTQPRYSSSLVLPNIFDYASVEKSIDEMWINSVESEPDFDPRIEVVEGQPVLNEQYLESLAKDIFKPSTNVLGLSTESQLTVLDCVTFKSWRELELVGVRRIQDAAAMSTEMKMQLGWRLNRVTLNVLIAKANAAIKFIALRDSVIDARCDTLEEANTEVRRRNLPHSSSQHLSRQSKGLFHSSKWEAFTPGSSPEVLSCVTPQVKGCLNRIKIKRIMDLSKISQLRRRQLSLTLSPPQVRELVSESTRALEFFATRDEIFRRTGTF